ncbi:hypothetical protein ACFE04_019341 [Oxalis oulophora]
MENPIPTIMTRPKKDYKSLKFNSMKNRQQGFLQQQSILLQQFGHFGKVHFHLQQHKDEQSGQEGYSQVQQLGRQVVSLQGFRQSNLQQLDGGHVKQHCHFGGGGQELHS